MKKAIAFVLAVVMSFSFVTPAFAKNNESIYVSESGVNLSNGSSNKEFYSQEEWERIFPDGTFIFEYSEYTAFEGGDDPSKKGDSYFGVNVIRMGGKNTRTDVTFDVTSISAAEDDFELTNDTLTFLPGEDMKTAYVKIIDNDTNQHERFLAISLISASKGHIGQMGNAMICIKDDEIFIETEISIKTQAKVDRSDGKALVKLTRPEQQSAYVFTVDIVTNELTAKAGEDYLTVEKTIVFGPGETEKTEIIPVLQSENNNDVDFEIELINPKGGTIEENSKKTKISVTNNGGDKTNPVHDTEFFLESVDKNNVADELTMSDENLTKNLDSITMNINQGMIDGRFLLKSAASAFSAKSVVQPFSATDGFGTWKLNEIWTHTSVSSDPKWFTFAKNEYFKGSVSGGNFKMKHNASPLQNGAFGCRITIPIDLNNLESFYYNFENNAGSAYAGKSYGQLNTLQKTYSYFETEHTGYKQFAQKKIMLNEGYYGKPFKVANLELGTTDGDSMDSNDITIYPFEFKRAAIPLSGFMSNLVKLPDGWEGKVISAGKTYTLKMSISGAEGGFGGTGVNPTIFIGSKVKYTLTPSAGDSTNIVTKIELKRYSDIHFSADLGSSAYSEGSYTFTRDFNTQNTNLGDAAYMCTRNLSGYSFAVTHIAAKDITVDYNAAGDLIDAAKAQNFVKLTNNSTTLNKKGAVGKTYNFGINNFAEMELDFPLIYGTGTKKAELDVYLELDGKQVKYEFDVTRGVVKIPFSKFVKNNIRILLVDSNAIKTNSYIEFNGHYVSHKIPTKSEWTKPEGLNPYVNSYAYETIHNPQKNPSNQIFDYETHNYFISDVIVGNVYLKPVNTTEEKYAFSLNLVDQNGLNKLHLLNFEHDTQLEKPEISAPNTQKIQVDVKDINKGLFSDSSPHKPKIEIIYRDALTMTYRISIPSSYNYELPDEIRALFKGNHKLELQYFNADLSDKYKEIRHVDNGKGIKIKLPNTTLESEEQNVETESADGQENMRVYSNESTSLEMPELGFDLDGIIGFFTAASPVDIGGGLQIGGDEITISFNIGGDLVSSDKSNKSGLQKGKDEAKDISKKYKSDKGLNPTNQPGKAKTSARGAGESAALGLGGGFAVTIRYDDMKGSWEFSECYMFIAVNGGYSTDIPFQPFPVVFLTFGVGGGLEIGTGFKSVPYKNIGGKVQRKIIFSGVNVSPSAYISIGVGVGIPNLVSISISGFVKAGLTASFAKANLIENFGDYDIIKSEDIFTFTGKWHEEEANNAFEKSLMRGEKGSKLVFSLDAYRFDLTGKLVSDGGTFNIKITNSIGKVLDEKKDISTKNSTEYFGALLYKYRGNGAESIKVTIEVTQGNVYFDALHFESSSELYKVEYIPASLDAWNIKVGIEGKIKVAFFSFSMELIYFLMNEQGLYWGYPMAEPQLIKKWEDFYSKRRSLAAEDSDNSALEIMPRNKELRLFNAKSINDFFDFGKLSDSYERKTVDNVVSDTTLNQIFYNDGHVYKFWIDDAGTRLRSDGRQRNALFYQIDDGETKIVEDDGTIDMEFTVGKTLDGKVKVIWSSYNKNVPMLETDDNIELLKHINSNIEIKSAVVEKDGSVKNVQIIPGTSDGVNDINLKSASNSKLEIVAFTKDRKGAYDANIPIVAPEIDPDDNFNAKLAEFMNAQYRGIPENYISITDSKGNTKTQKVETGVSDEFWKVGTMVTSNDITFIDDENVVLAYTAEIPSAQKAGRSGKNNLMFLQYGKVNKDTNEIKFSDALLIKEIFNYDDDLNVVFPDGIPNEYVRRDKSYFENPILGQISFRTNPKNGDTTLFFKSNDMIETINQETLESFKEENRQRKLRRVIAPIPVDSQEYDINYTTTGRLYMLYSKAAENGYDNQLMIRYYDDAGYWTESVQISYGYAFDQEQLDASGDTGRVAFEKLSSVIIEDENSQKLIVLNQVSYAPFKYLKVLDLEGKEENVSYLDENDSKAIRSLLEFSVIDVRNAIKGSEINMNSNMFIEGRTNTAEFSIANIGTNNIENFKVELRTENKIIVESQELSVLLPGMSYSSTDFIATSALNSIVGMPFEITQGMFNDGDVIYYVLKDTTGIIYDSRNDGYKYSVNMSRAELEFGESKLDWTYENSESKLSYVGQINNIGHKALDEDVSIVFEAMILDENSEMIVDKNVGDKGVLGKVSLSKDLVNNQPENTLYNLTGELDMPSGIVDLSLNVRMRIEYGIAHTSEYEIFNNVTDNKKVDAPIKIITGFEKEANILNLHVGDVVDFTELKIISPVENLSVSQLDIYEVDSDHLSINHSSSPPSIKVMSTADDLGVTQVRLAFNIKGTMIETTLHLNLDRSIFINLDGVDDKLLYSGWKKHTLEEGHQYIRMYENDYIVNENREFMGEGTITNTIAFKIDQAKRISLYAFEDMAVESVSIKLGNDTYNLKNDTWQYTLEGKPYFVFDIPETHQNDIDTLISIEVANGKGAVLDYIKLDGAIDDLPVDDAFLTADESGYKLDAPIQNGRNRKAEVYFVMSEAVALKQGVNKEDFSIELAVKKVDDNTGKSTDSAVTVTLDRISEDGKTLYFVLNNIVSEPKYTINYSLKTTSIPDNKLVKMGTNNDVNSTPIPGVSSIKFSLLESKIEKVELIDNSKESGKLGKDILVTFEKTPDISRLTGTTILFKDIADNEIEFKFVETSDANTKQALYHADISVGVDEMSNTYTFEKGVLLNDNYALMSKDGNFIDGAITTSQLASFKFNRAFVVGTPTLERFIDINNQRIGEKIVSSITFDRAVKLSSFTDDLAYIEVSRALYSKASDEVENETIKLYAKGISNQDKTVRFESKEYMKYEDQDKVTYGLVSSKIQYSGNDSSKWIVDSASGISANVSLGKTANISFNPKASIQYATLKLDGGFKNSAMKPVVEVVINSDIYLPNAIDSTISIKELREFTDETTEEITRKLVFEKIEKLNSKTYNDEELFVATFIYPDDDIDFAQNEDNKQFELLVNTPVVIKDGLDFMNKDNNIVIANEILSVNNEENLIYTKVKVETVSIERSDVNENDEPGNIITVKVKYDGKVNIADLEAVSIDLIKSETDESNVVLTAPATDFDSETNTITFVAKDMIYSAGKSIKYSLPTNIDGSHANIIDENLVSVSTLINGMSELTINTDEAFISEMNFNFNDISLENPIPKLEITYPVAVSGEDLADTEIIVTSSWLNKEGFFIEEDKEITLVFEEIINEGKTIVYSLSGNNDLPEKWLTSFWKVLDTNIPSVIKNKGNSIILDTTLPAVETATYARPSSHSVKFVNNHNDMFSFNFKSLDLVVEFDKTILLDENSFSDIQIKAKMNVKDKSGKVTTEEVIFVANKILDYKTILFSCVVDKEFIGELSINSDQTLILEYLNGKGVFDASSQNMLAYEILSEANIEISVREVPKTGENNNIMILFSLFALLSLGTLFISIVGKKRKK